MAKSEKLGLIRETGVIAIMRAQSSGQLIAAADAIKHGGVNVIELDAGDMEELTRRAAAFIEEVRKGRGR
jgi:2-keto-3-deoxy-6-phosphogluconate aldolase